MGRSTRDKILDAAIGATSGLTAILALAFLFSPTYNDIVVFGGVIVLAYQLFLEWREPPSPPAVHSDDE